MPVKEFVEVIVMLSDEMWTPPEGVVYAGGYVPEPEQQVTVIGDRDAFTVSIDEVGAWFFKQSGDLKSQRELRSAYRALYDI